MEGPSEGSEPEGGLLSPEKTTSQFDQCWDGCGWTVPWTDSEIRIKIQNPSNKKRDNERMFRCHKEKT